MIIMITYFIDPIGAIAGQLPDSKCQRYYRAQTPLHALTLRFADLALKNFGWTTQPCCGIRISNKKSSKIKM